MNIKAKDEAYIAQTYGRFPIVLTEGKGCYVKDEDGNKYLDMTAGIGVNSLGIANETWVSEVCKQANQLAHVSNLYYTKPAVEVAETLCQKTGCHKVLFSNSGAEANEAAIKVARKYSFDKYGSNRHEIITLINSFHGRTITTLSATGQDQFHQYFDPFTPGFQYAIANDLEDMKAHITNQTCAILLEVVQGEGGVLPLSKDYVKAIEMLCNELDILLIIDEVQTGVGRTGTFYAYEQFGIKPDIVTTAKGLGSGLPIGAVLLFDKCEHTFHAGDHGTTFGGNPIACAGANVVVKYLTTECLQEIQQKGQYLKEQLEQLPHVVEVNGMGLMLGIVLEKGVEAKQIVASCLKQGLLLLTAKNNVRLLPPLTITKAELQQGIQILKAVLIAWEEN